MTLTEFLLARIAEDERLARDADVPDWEVSARLGDESMMARPASKRLRRVVAECEAKRRVVTLMGYVRESWENMHAGEGRVMWPDVSRREKMHALAILENLALPYADHPDYCEEEWRP